MSWYIEQGDVADVLAWFADNSFDALFCDPPYGFSFMGKAWDYDVPSGGWSSGMREGLTRAREDGRPFEVRRLIRLASE